MSPKRPSLKPGHRSSGNRSETRTPSCPERGRGEARSNAAANKDGRYWLYGRHAVSAALGNSARRIHRLWLTKAGEERLGPVRAGIPIQPVEAEQLARLLGDEAVHQGIAAEVNPLEGWTIEDALENPPADAVLLVLDQVTDPHNVGAILRTAAAFGVHALVLARDHAPTEGATMAKTACGGLEIVPMVYVTNLARAMEQMKQAGFWTVGLEGEAKQTLHAHGLSGRLAVVLGAEGKGLRRLTVENCDLLARLPIRAQMESLNVSNAAAIALYELCGRRMD